MKPSLLIRPVSLCLTAVVLGGCGLVESDPRRFERLAEMIAALPVDGGAATGAAMPSTAAGLKPAIKVEVLELDEFYAAREADMLQSVQTVATDAAVDVAPIMVEAVKREASARLQGVVERTGLRGAIPAAASTPTAAPRLVQLGAFSSEASARAAWSRLQSGPAATALSGVKPFYEPTTVDGRTLVRLRIPKPAANARVVCAAAAIDAQWCRNPA